MAALLALALCAARASAQPPGPWTRISYNELTRVGAASCFDPVGRRFFFYGYYYSSPISSESDIHSVMRLTLDPVPKWTSLHPAGTEPPATQFASMVYDPVGDRVIFIGGGGVYELSLGATPTWSALATNGIGPGGASSSCAIYDPVGQRIIVHGGAGYQTDTWALSLDSTPTWTHLATSGPVIGHTRAAAIYDPIGHRMIVDGGGFSNDGAGHDYTDETWALSLDDNPTWTSLTPESGPRPPLRQLHGAAYDPLRHALVIFGGYSGYESGQAWSLSLDGTPQWTQLATTGAQPGQREMCALFADPVADRVVMFGGLSIFLPAEQQVFDDCWSLPLAPGSEWQRLIPDGGPPSLAPWASAVIDPTDGSMLVYGGELLPDKPPTPLRKLSLTPPYEWRELHPTGPTPDTPSRHSAIVDPIGQRMIVFGGIRASDGVTTNETWALGLGPSPAWSPLATSGTPPDPRHSHTAIYDAAHRRMIVYGGETPGVGFRQDAWQLTLDGTPTWSELPANDWRSQHTAVYDDVRQRMVVFGGRTGTVDWVQNFLGDVQALDLGPVPEWHSLVPAGPSPRRGAAAMFYPISQLMYVFAGFDGAAGVGEENDTWELALWPNFNSWYMRSLPEPKPVHRSGHNLLYDAAHDQMLVYGGSVFVNARAANDTWAFPLDPCSLSVITAAPVPLALLYGQTATFNVTATHAINYQWLKNGQPLNESFRITGTQTPTLTITDFQSDDLGSYSARVGSYCPGPQESAAAALTLAPPCGGTPATPPAGMAAWWAMEPGPGNTIPDVLHPVGNKNHASLTGAASLVQGKVGTGVRCNGVNDGLHVPATLSPQLAANSTGLSIDAWILPRSGSSANAYRMILQKGLLKKQLVHAGGVDALAPGYAFYLCNGGRLGFQMPDNDYQPVRFEPAMPPLTMDLWHHVAVTTTPAAGAGHFYLDGAEVGSFTPPSGILGNLADLYIGRFTPQLGPSLPDSAFNGDIDEVEIFTNEVSASDIHAIWAAGCTGKRRVQLLAPSVVELRSSGGETSLCASLYNLGVTDRTYDWSFQTIAGTGCGAATVNFTPASGQVTVPAGQRVTLSTTAWAPGAAMTAPFSDCYQLRVVDESDGGVITAAGTVAYTGEHVSAKGPCSPPELAATSKPVDGTTLPMVLGGNGQATFQLFNDSATPATVGWRARPRDAVTGGASALLRLGGGAAGQPLSGTQNVPAYGSANVAVPVAVTGDEPTLADDVVLALDRDGSFVDVAVAHVAVSPDTSLALTDVPRGGPALPGTLELRAAPNPFAAGTSVLMRLPRAAHVACEVFDAHGRRVRDLGRREAPAGETRIDWDGRDQRGSSARGGLYFVRVTAGSEQRVVRVVKLEG